MCTWRVTSSLVLFKKMTPKSPDGLQDLQTLVTAAHSQVERASDKNNSQSNHLASVPWFNSVINSATTNGKG
jgi:hypothetical protein